jgi:hypothetical protein
MGKKPALRVAAVFLVGITAVVFGCDPAQLLWVKKADDGLFCEKRENTRYTVTVQWKDGESETYTCRDCDEVKAGLVPGWEDRMQWIQYSIYCADSAEPLVVTPRLTPDDFVQNDEWNFFYFLKE